MGGDQTLELSLLKGAQIIAAAPQKELMRWFRHLNCNSEVVCAF